MPAPYSTLALSPPTGNPGDPNYKPGWDLYVDSSGNIAVNQPPLAVAQDVASACRLFQGELWFDVTQGMPYFQKILGYLPSVQFLKSQFIAAAKTVPGVASVVCYLTGLGQSRVLGGQLQITDTAGGFSVAGTGGLQGGNAPWYVLAGSPTALYGGLPPYPGQLLSDYGVPLTTDPPPEPLIGL